MPFYFYIEFKNGDWDLIRKNINILQINLNNPNTINIQFDIDDIKNYINELSKKQNISKIKIVYEGQRIEFEK
jgi:hypothetical protein